MVFSALNNSSLSSLVLVFVQLPLKQEGSGQDSSPRQEGLRTLTLLCCPPAPPKRPFLTKNMRVLPSLSFLSLFFCEEFLVFLSVFPFFSRDFRGSAGIKNPCFFGGFPGNFPKKQGKEGQGWLPLGPNFYITQLYCFESISPIMQ